MLRSIWTSRSALNANQERLNVISNNLANSSTTSYKREDVGFKDLLNETLDRRGYPLEDKKADMGTGVRVTNWYKNYNQGVIIATGTNTDLCLERITETAFFRVFNTQGEALYTRDGSFKIDMQGNIVDSNGYRLELQYEEGINPEEVNFRNKDIKINEVGEITIKQGEEYVKVAKINTYTSTGNQAFRSIGDSYYLPNEGAEIRVATDTIMHQGALEASNVDMAQEITDMILTQRAFQLNTKGLETADEMWGMINNMSSR